MRNSPTENKAFAARLKQALKRSPKKVETPGDLAVQFNLRYKGDPITPQAAQKWLAGTARPTLDKLETLAEWLDVSLQWFRYGIAEDRPQTSQVRKAQGRKSAVALQPTEDELKLLARLRNLSEHQRHLVHEIVEQFALEREMWRE